MIASSAELALVCASRLALLAVPAVLGALAGRLRLFPEPDRAVSALNVFALYFGFPALVFVGIVDGRFELPTAPAFWLFVPVTELLLVLALRAAFAAMGLAEQAGTVALTTLFGNVAYLGLPFVTALLGPAERGVIALGVSLHVVLAVGVGPILLRLWSGGRTDPSELRNVLRQPLLWAPVVGLITRALPAPAPALAEVVAAPLGAAAAPVALFLLGLYLFTQRHALGAKHRGATLHVGVKLLLAPGVAWLAAAALVRMGQLAPTHGAIFVMLAGMPAAITTFSIAHAVGIGEERIAVVIVRSSLGCVVTLPALFVVAQAL